VDERDLLLDGNAAGGLLGEIFAIEMTAAEARCAACGALGRVGELRVYSGGPGLVARCPVCDAAVMRIVRTEGRAWLDLRGLRFLELHL
jgi:Family of unknown function (DUF6510)